MARKSSTHGANSKAMGFENFPNCIRNPLSLGIIVTVNLSVLIPIIVKEVADNNDEDLKDFHEALIDALPWGGGAAGVWLVLLTMATRNVDGPGAILKPIIWLACPFLGLPLFTVFIAVLLLVCRSSLLPPILFGLLSIYGAIVSYLIYDPDLASVIYT
ncbi:hypothetical protein TrST_g13101 [Triparma strigata]|uniref:Uncharacterized protein n=1 Tax=Triparma strigata TaxID=1606541 RepID=A0A9W7AU40_9STRA|nr:hypothetical protein TrST_g13101 [Triparma strigata]